LDVLENVIDGAVVAAMKTFSMGDVMYGKEVASAKRDAETVF
jgi:hypothetical protein